MNITIVKHTIFPKRVVRDSSGDIGLGISLKTKEIGSVGLGLQSQLNNHKETYKRGHHQLKEIGRLIKTIPKKSIIWMRFPAKHQAVLFIPPRKVS